MVNLVFIQINDLFKNFHQQNQFLFIKFMTRLLSTSCITLSSEVETPTFYQTLAGVTHLEEQDICELEKCFWSLQSSSPSGHLDLNCVTSLISPPVPASACQGLFLALDVNRDGHIDFKELCCGISAACRGPTAERMKFCFKIFDMDRDNLLNQKELQHMIDILLFVAKENKLQFELQKNSGSKNSLGKSNNHELLEHQNNEMNLLNDCKPFSSDFLDQNYDKLLMLLKQKLNPNGAVTQEDFLMWSVDNNILVAPLLELLFQVCHVSLGLKPHCRHHEYEIGMRRNFKN